MPEYLPIIFVHGWGGIADVAKDFGAEAEVDPYAGWNEGRRYNLNPDEWVKYRELGGNFEGIILRLIKNHDYIDAVNNEELRGVKPEDKRRTLWILRYYERLAPHLAPREEEKVSFLNELIDRGFKDPDQVGKGKRDDKRQAGKLFGVPLYACQLAKEINTVCQRVYGNDPNGKVFLAGHSMGGLISRFAIQYNLFGVRSRVYKLVTFSTPHGGAALAQLLRPLAVLPAHRDDDFRHLDPAWVQKHLDGNKVSVAKLLPKEKVYAIVGCNHKDYYPLARRIPVSDGIVRQNEGYLEQYPWTFVYNTHSGQEGVRENMAPYEIMDRFLFGGRRVILRAVNVEIAGDHDPLWFGDGAFFFHHYVKPFGVNVHFNEISERCENAPRPRSKEEIQQYFKERGGYAIFDGFLRESIAERTNINVPAGYRPQDFGVKTPEDIANLPTLSVEFEVLEHDPMVGGHLIDGGRVAVPIRIHKDDGALGYAGTYRLNLTGDGWTWAGKYTKFLLEVETRPDT